MPSTSTKPHFYLEKSTDTTTPSVVSRDVSRKVRPQAGAGRTSDRTPTTAGRDGVTTDTRQDDHTRETQPGNDASENNGALCTQGARVVTDRFRRDTEWGITPHQFHEH